MSTRAIAGTDWAGRYSRISWIEGHMMVYKNTLSRMARENGHSNGAMVLL